MSTSSVAAQKGRSFLLKLASGASPTNYITVAGLRTTQLKINGNPVDISNKNSAGWRELLAGAGVRSLDITGSGVYSDTTQTRALQTAALNGGDIVEAQCIFGAGDKYTGEWSVSDFTRNGPHNTEETFDITLQSHGVVTYTPAS